MSNMFAAVLVIAARTYDLTFPAAPVSRIVAALAHQSGETLAVDPSVGKEIVALRLHKATLPTAMRRLAEGLNATWRGEKLVRTSDRLSGERQAFANLCRRTLRKDYAPSPRPTYDNPAYIQATERLQKLEDAKNYAAFRVENPKREALAPLSVFARDLDRLLTPGFCESLGPGHFVFRSRPNPRQHPLTPDQSLALARFQTADRTLRNQAPALALPHHPAQLELICDIEPAKVTARFIVQDADGTPISGDYCADRQLTHVLKPLLQPRATPHPEIAVASSQTAEEIRRLLARHLLPEPLAATGATLIRCAETQGEDLVAVLGDDLVAPSYAGSKTIENYLDDISRLGYEVLETPGLLRVTPHDRAAIRRQQVNRTALAEYLDLNLRSPSPSLADLLRLSPNLPFRNQAYPIENWLTNLGVQDLIWNEPIVRIIGRLPRTRKLLFRQLQPDLQASLTAIIRQDGDGDFREKFRAFCGTGWETAPDETDIERPAIPPDAIVRVDESIVPCFSVIRPSRTAWSENQIAVDNLEYYVPLEDTQPIRAGRLHRLDISLQLAQGLTYQNRLEALEVTHPSTHLNQIDPTLLEAVRREEAKRKHP